MSRSWFVFVHSRLHLDLPESFSVFLKLIDTVKFALLAQCFITLLFFKVLARGVFVLYLLFHFIGDTN
jgi:hypothetical protein